jgi:hypothetical protein
VRHFSVLMLAGLAIAGCSADQGEPESPQGGVEHASAFERAAKLAEIQAPLPDFRFEGEVSPVGPIGGALTLRAWQPVWWDPADGSRGTIKLDANGNSAAGLGSRAELLFAAEAGRHYLVHCEFAEYISPTSIRTFFTQGLAGTNVISSEATEFAVASEKVASSAPGAFEFYVDQSERRVVGCKAFSYVSTP